MNSKRRYTLAIAESDQISLININLAAIAQTKDGDYEYLYALNDMLDEILDMQVHEAKYFQFNRDNPNSKAIILRTE